MSNNNYTFWKLINKYSIEIPIIQRDYAQGRNNPKSKDIRKTFIEQIKAALSNPATTLHLNFIYGKVNNNIFIPLDGQQRLTTLFLIHWYLMPEIKIVLKKFSYKIRSSSEEFCKVLVENRFKIPKGQELSKSIENSSWFRMSWKKDPTVNGMLRMINEIDKQLTGVNKTNYWNNLTNKDIISFEFLDLKKHNLTDDLYIKMNSRGKVLTDFENFKSWLIEYVEEKEKKEHKEKYIIETFDEEEKWNYLIDTKWADLFWKYKDGANMLIDEEYMRFFRNMAQIYFVQKDISFDNKKKDGEGKKNIEIANQLASKKGADKEYIFVPNSFYEVNDVFTADSLNDFFKIIDIIAKKDERIIKCLELIDFFNGKKPLFVTFISGDMTYKDKVLFYAMSLYLLKCKNIDNETAFKQWMRVVRNLVENSTLGIDNLGKIIKELQRLSEKSKDILSYFNTLKQDEIKAFDSFQIKEEIVKAKLIKNRIDENWEGEFIKAENHSLFRGNIRFLINNFSDELEILNIDFELFKHHSEHAQKYFYKEGVVDKLCKDSIFLRALVSQFTEQQQLHSIVYDNNAITWRNIFRKENLHVALRKVLDKNEIIDMQFLQEIDSPFSDKLKHVHEDLFKSDFLISNIVNGIYMRKWWADTYVFFPYNAKSKKKKYIIGEKRNIILADLISNHQISLTHIDQQLETKDGKKIPFFWGVDISFRFNDEEFIWKGNNMVLNGTDEVAVNFEYDFIDFIKNAFSL